MVASVTRSDSVDVQSFAGSMSALLLSPQLLISILQYPRTQSAFELCWGAALRNTNTTAPVLATVLSYEDSFTVTWNVNAAVGRAQDFASLFAAELTLDY